MSDTSYFWQGKRKIEIQQDDSEITVHAAAEPELMAAAADVGVELASTTPAAAGLFKATVIGDRDRAVDRLRAADNIVHHVYRNRDGSHNEYLITESFFLKFKANTPESLIREYFEAEKLIVERAMGENTFLVKVTNSTGRNPIRTANAAATRDDVEYAEPNLVRRITRFAFIPPDVLFSRQWHLHAPAVATDLVAGAGIFAPEAWDLTRGRRSVVVAVADDGFDLTHPDFQGQGKVAGRLNAVVSGNENDTSIAWNSEVSPQAGDYHGTPCLGVAVAEGNGTGVVGVAPGCSLLALRFPLSMNDAQFIAMFEKISSLADVVSCSWGVGPGNFGMSTALTETITRLAESGGRRGKGLIFCVAAGNNNCPVRDLTNTRVYKFRNQFGGLSSATGAIDRWIAAHPDVITVSASTSRLTRSAYSSWGKEICVCAPSDNWNDLDQSPLPGLGITTTDNEGSGPGSDFTSGSRFTSGFGGTSSATPTVAGICALMISANPSLSAADVRKILQDSADKIGFSFISDNPVNELGDFDNNGFSLWFGHGKANAFKAVGAAAQLWESQKKIDLKKSDAVPIPDDGSSVFSDIEIPEEGAINELRVKVQIDHEQIGDLRVDLIAPDGLAVSLHNLTGSAARLSRTYTVENTGALRALLGRPIRGTWRLRIRDSFPLGQGSLKEWRIAARVA